VGESLSRSPFNEAGVWPSLNVRAVDCYESQTRVLRRYELVDTAIRTADRRRAKGILGAQVEPPFEIVRAALRWHRRSFGRFKAVPVSNIEQTPAQLGIKLNRPICLEGSPRYVELLRLR
jgi:hypothetical protein